jgi:CRP-like cAMP-binding protein
VRIENEIFQFHPSSPFDKLQLPDLQKQYLADLLGQNTIQALTQRYLASGWLVNFKLLYELVATLVQHHWILNPTINDYFKKLEIKNEDYKSQMSQQARASAPHSEDKLMQLPFFRSLPKDFSKILLQKAKIYKYPPQALICKQGESSRDLYVLLKGEAAVYAEAGHFKKFISILEESSVFGEAGFFLAEKRSADVLTQKVCEVLVVPYQAEVLDLHLNVNTAQSIQQRFWVQHALLHSDFFKKIPPDCLDALTSSGKILDLAEKILFNEGDARHSAYIVIQGSLIVQQKGKTINTLSQGSFLGEISLMLNDGRRTATVICQPNTKVLEIQRAEFYQLLGQNLFLAKEFQILADERLKKDILRTQRL